MWTEAGRRGGAAGRAARRRRSWPRLETGIGYDYGALTLEDKPSAHPLRLDAAARPRRRTASRCSATRPAPSTRWPGRGSTSACATPPCWPSSWRSGSSLGLDPATPSTLEAYERARRFDGVVMAGATDGLNRLFSNDSLPARLLRDLGLGLVDRRPGPEARPHPRCRRAFGCRAEGVRTLGTGVGGNGSSPNTGKHLASPPYGMLAERASPDAFGKGRDAVEQVERDKQPCPALRHKASIRPVVFTTSPK